MIAAGRYAAADVTSLAHGVFSLKAVIIGAVTLVVTEAFLFVDWHSLLVKKKLAFNFKIWR